MQHFFVSPQQVKEEKIYVEGSDVNHIKNVLRMKLGEKLTVNDGEGWQYLCEVESYEADMAVLHIVEKSKAETELSSRIYLFQGLPKQDKMELIVQKAVELGAYQVIPVSTKRAVVKLDAKKKELEKQEDELKAEADRLLRAPGEIEGVPETGAPTNNTPVLARQPRVGIITSNFHLCRAAMIAKKQDYGTVYGIASEADKVLLVHFSLRDGIALLKDRLMGNL
mgnify:CR=1 FL=1